MKRRIALGVAGVGALAFGFFQVVAPPPRPLAQLMPGGALIYLEAQDFGSLVQQWNGSGTKARWLASANYEMFSRSNLFLKLSDLFKEYAGAAGFTPDLAAVARLAGRESALALFDIREVEFCYITRLTAAQAAETRLWGLRSTFESREAAGRTFYVRVDAASGRTVAFAAVDGYLILATRDELVAGVLGLLGNAGGQNIAAAPWYRRVVDAAGAAGDVRMVMNLEALVENTHFRSYWIQRNASYLRMFETGIADLVLGPREVVERRLLARVPGGEAASVDAEARGAMAEAVRLLPAEAGLGRAWVQPGAEEVSALVVEKVLRARAPSAVEMSYYSPEVFVEARMGEESDLETRIDDPPVSATPAAFDAGPVTEMFRGAGVLAAASMQAHRVRAGVTFIEVPAAVAVVGRAEWRADRVREVFGDSARRLWSLRSSTAAWRTEAYRGGDTFVLEGLASLAFAVRGRVLVLASDPGALRAVLDRMAAGVVTTDADYVSVFWGGRERGAYGALTGALETARVNADPSNRFFPAGAAEPPFFSGNIASIADTLRLVSVRVSERDGPAGLEQEVRYVVGQ